MAFNLRNRNFLKLLDFTPREIQHLLDLSMELKKAKYNGYEQPTLTGKNIALIFEKTSFCPCPPRLTQRAGHPKDRRHRRESATVATARRRTPGKAVSRPQSEPGPPPKAAAAPRGRCSCTWRHRKNCATMVVAWRGRVQ